ncbi:MAG: M1 family aminopeptidase, partial [Candidatus Acidiferrales bacterium]
MTRSRRPIDLSPRGDSPPAARSCARALFAVALSLVVVRAGFAQAAPPPPPSQAREARPAFFRATNYTVKATLEPQRHLLAAVATVEYETLQPSRALEAELNPNLRLKQVYAKAGQALPFERIPLSPRVTVTLPNAMTTGDKLTLTFEYEGPLADSDTALSGGVRHAYIGDEGAYLLLSSRWFPLTNYPASRFTGTFEITVPETWIVAGTGRALAPTVASAAPVASAPAAAEPPRQRPRRPGQEEAPPPPPAPAQEVAPRPAPRSTYPFRVEKPAPAGTFAAGPYQMVPVSAEGISVSVYMPTGNNATAKDYGEAAGKAINSFSARFGALPDPTLAIVQLPNVPAVPSGESAPGLILLGARQWTRDVNYRLVARLVAEQWWANQIRPASADDVWLSDGLSRYSEGLYVSEVAGEEGFNRALEDFAVGALMYEDAAALGQASQLKRYSAEYRSVIENKGATVFHMLRGQMGDASFDALLRDYYAEYSGRSASISDFQRLAQEKANAAAAGNQPLNLTPFFAQWMNSTGIPDFELEYTVLRTQKGFRIIGKVKQDLETFRMKVGVKVETEGNPEEALIDVVGAESDFTIETFGRPKPGGIILDPQNHLLKASPRLRVRASIARGEFFAEQGKYYEAIQEYQTALERQKNSSLAHFRMAEAFFYQKNYQAAAQAFRDSIDGDRDPKWVEVWGHIYIGKIFDLTGQRERALNEYERARNTNDDTGGAQAEIERLIKEPYA